jgi:hypothetical protein
MSRLPQHGPPARRPLALPHVRRRRCGRSRDQRDVQQVRPLSADRCRQRGHSQPPPMRRPAFLHEGTSSRPDLYRRGPSLHQARRQLGGAARARAKPRVPTLICAAARSARTPCCSRGHQARHLSPTRATPTSRRAASGRSSIATTAARRSPSRPTSTSGRGRAS